MRPEKLGKTYLFWKRKSKVHRRHWTCHDRWGGNPPLNHGRADVTPMNGARQRQLCLTSSSLLPHPFNTKTSHLFRHPHNTLVYNYPPQPHTPSTQYGTKLCKIVFPKYSSQNNQQGFRLVGVRVRIPHLDVLPIIVSVSPQPIPCLFTFFYESVLYVYTFFSP